MNLICRENCLSNNENKVKDNGKMFYTERKVSTRKQAFVELKNVFHNQNAATLKENSDNGRIFFPKSTFNIDSQDVVTNIGDKETHEFTDLEEFHDDWDISKNGCKFMCSRDLEDVWSEMNIIDQGNIKKFGNFKDDDDLYDSGNDSDISNTSNELFKQLDFTYNIQEDSMLSNESTDWKLFSKEENIADFSDFIDEDFEF